MVALVANLAAERQQDRPTPLAKPSPKAPAASGALRKKNERTPVDRFNRMSPEQRQQALEKLPPERRKKIEDQLNQYNSLTPEQRRQLRSRYQAFNQFPPEKQNQARRLFRQFGELPPARQGPIRQEFENLRTMPDAERRARMNSDEFRNKYDSHEQKFLSDLSGLLQ
ncbi:MAG: hypothetical protein JWO48_3250 [Bryobacterales bacterium]|nr:hypothetical protein [Bryobacterales bacterium]